MPTCSACGQDNPDVARFCLGCGAALQAAAPDRRKLATLLFCDVTGSTALGERTDAETVRELMFRYFHEMRAAIERHGGTVEKFVGDAVMAAFGIPETHEDDALRACRAALEMQERITALAPELERRFGMRLEARIGINSGEVVAGGGRETFASGDAVNVAARLEQSAQPGEVLIGEPTLALVRETVEVEPVAPVRAKGKAEPVPAFRLRSVATRTPLPAGAPAFVGRGEELRSLLEAFGSAVRDRRARLVTVVGEPGVGKSRLVAELERAVAARVLRGHCLSYGDGITFWPLAEIVRNAASIRDEDSAERARAKLEALAEPEVADRVAALLGLGGAVAPDEVAWTVRRFVSALASEQPLVLLVEDVHWAEPTLLDLLGELGGMAAPVLVVATARPELLEQRSEWPGVIRLEPLGADEARNLLAQLLEREPDAALVERAGGNPLFVHELAALMRQGGDADALPASLGALLAARLDRLSSSDRETVERASVEGAVFHRGAVAALLETDIRAASERLAALVEREFAFPEEARFVDEAAFHFRHVLVRDAAYAGVVKRLRAELHERLADWIEQKAGDRLAEVEEIVGYHLEQAHRYASALRLDADHLALRGAERLYGAGGRAAERGDISAAANLLERALVLTPEQAPQRAERLLRFGRVLFLAGESERIGPIYDEAERLAAALGDERLVAYARLERWREAGRDETEILATAEAALPLFERARDDRGLAKAWAAIADYHWSRSNIEEAHDAFERSLAFARGAGDREQEEISLARLSGTLRWGPVRVAEAIARMERELAHPAVPLHPRAVWTAFMGTLEARRGNVDRGRALCASARTLLEDVGDLIAEYLVCDALLEVHLLAGDLDAAGEVSRELVERGEQVDEGFARPARLLRARVLIDQGRCAEAETLLELLEPADAHDEAIIGLTRARLLARGGEAEEAARLARAGAAHFDANDSEPMRAEAHRQLADVLRMAGKPGEARAALGISLELEERLGATLLAERTRALIRELDGA